MKKYMKYLVLATAAVAAPAMMTSCSEDEYYNVDVNGIPEASAYVDNFKVTVDQETNTAYFEFDGKGVYPVWIIDGKTYSTTVAFSRYYRKAGEYNVECKVGNGNGVSTGTITKSFTIEKTKMNGFAGFVYDSEYNMWKNATKQEPTFFYAHTNDWVTLPNPTYSFDGDAYTLSLPTETINQWQAQMHVVTDMCVPQGEHMDGSLILTSTTDVKNVTIKIHPNGDDDDSHSFFPQQTVNLKAGEPAAFFFSDLEAVVDMNNIVYTFDFGGNPADTEVTIENIVLKKHSDDDGTVLPELPTEPSIPEPTWVDLTSADNLLWDWTYTMGYYYAPNWSQIDNPGFADNGDGSYTFTLPSATFERWQAQCAFNTTLALPDPEQSYDFLCEIESNVATTIMIKLVQTDEGVDNKHDDNFLFADEVKVVEGTNRIYMVDVKASKGEAMHAVTLLYDFGTNPENSEFTVGNIILQKHHD